MIKALDDDPGELNSIPGPATDSLCDLGLNLFAPLFPICGTRIILLSLSPTCLLDCELCRERTIYYSLYGQYWLQRRRDQSRTSCCSAPSNSQRQQQAATFRGMAPLPSSREASVRARNVKQVWGKATRGFAVTVMAIFPRGMLFPH